MRSNGYREALVGVSRSEILQVVEEYVHNARARELIRITMVDGYSYTDAAGMVQPEMSTNGVQDVINRWMPVVLDKLGDK